MFLCAPYGSNKITMEKWIIDYQGIQHQHTFTNREEAVEMSELVYRSVKKTSHPLLVGRNVDIKIEQTATHANPFVSLCSSDCEGEFMQQ